MTLKDLLVGESGRVTIVGGEGQLRRHFLDMGLVPGAVVTLVKYAPMGDPMELSLHGYSLTLRVADAEHIEVQKLTREEQSAHAEQKEIKKQTLLEETLRLYGEQHPGLGEGGKYHDKETEQSLPEDKVLNFALAGNQNCGKTTLFNQLTGSNQHVGNFPGVTVDRKSGQLRGYENTELVDLPGIYSLSPYTAEEIVSRKYILDENPAGIINIVDATNIERNLILTTQLMELEVPMVLALNMMDEVSGNGGSINVNAMEELLGIPVVPISAAKNEGVDELTSHALHVAKYQEFEGRTDFCRADEAGGAVHRCIHGIISLIEDHAKEAGIPARFAATKLVEGDEITEDALKLDQNEKEMIEHIILQMENERGMDRVAAIADMRLEFIEKLCAATVVKPKESKEKIRSERIDKILTGKHSAIPSFIAIMAVIFYLTFVLVGPFLQGLLEDGISAFTLMVSNALIGWGVSAPIYSLVIDGIFAGVGSVLSFVPVIVILFFFLSLLEDSGYMARIAFVTDKLLRKIGLSGRSIVPMVIGFGCSVPSIMATRTLPSERDRKMTIMLTPFMSCTAKLPVYAFFANAFFPGYTGLVTVGLYVLAIIIGLVVALIAKKTYFKGEAVPFVMELPNYRLPSARNVLLLLWDKAKDFLQKAFTIILVASVVIWFLSNFNFHMQFVGDAPMLDRVGMQYASILAAIAGFVAPVFAPLGLGDWRFPTALVAGFVAKESVVSTLNILFAGDAIASVISPASAMALLVFSLLYTPCVAAIAAVKRESGAKSAFLMVVFQCVLAWVMAFITYLIAA